MHSLIETQHRGLAHKIIDTSPSISPASSLHTLHTRTTSKKRGSSSAPPTPGYTPYPSFPFWQGLYIGPSELASALFIENLDHGGPDGMVWPRDGTFCPATVKNVSGGATVTADKLYVLGIGKRWQQATSPAACSLCVSSALTTSSSSVVCKHILHAELLNI